jgi:hypothetical protein
MGFWFGGKIPNHLINSFPSILKGYFNDSKTLGG